MKFVEKKKVGWPGPAGNGYNARRGGVIKFLQMSVAKRWLCAAGRRCTRGRGGNEKSRRQKREGKKKEKERKKRRRAGTPPRGGVVSVPALSILRHLLILLSPPPVGALVYRGYKQTRAGHTDEVTNAGHLHLAARVALSLPSLSFSLFFLLSFSLTLFSRVPLPPSFFSRFSSLSLFSPFFDYRVSIFPSLRLSHPLVLFLCDSRAGCSRFGNERARTCVYVRVCARVCRLHYVRWLGTVHG